jgi:predicted AAA+ superfamily ATPase
MPYVPRFITQRLQSLASAFPAVVLTGARQVGKSTLVQETFGKVAQTVVFDPVVDVENARSDPDLFLNNHRTPLILDEIQYAPELVAAIKRRIDRDRTPGQYLMTGSQQWGVLKTMAESLAGRVVFLDLDGFCLGEVASPQAKGPWLPAWLADPERFLASRPERLTTPRTLYEQLWRGWLPEAQFLSPDTIPDFHQAYQRTCIERDVRLLVEVSDWQLFGRFVRLVSALTAQEINHSQLGRELGLTPQTSRRWLDVLVATFQWFELPAYSGNTIKRVSLKPKGYLADTGLACSSQAMTSPQAVGGHPLWGALFETAVAAELRKQVALMSPRPNLYHWRSHAGAEVDFLLERDGVFYPIEAKAGSMPRRSDTRGIAAFRETYPGLKVSKGLVLAPTESTYPLSENDVVVPWDIDGAR